MNFRFLGILGLIAGASSLIAGNFKPTAAELFDRADALFVPTVSETFDLDKLPLTHIAGAERSPTKDNVARFVAKQRDIALGWGNYDNKQPVAERVAIWKNFTLTCQCRMTTPGTGLLNFRIWGEGLRDGAPGGSRYGEYTRTFKDTQWQKVSFAVNRFAAPDGFELTFRFDKNWRDAALEIKDLKISREFRRGCFARDIVIPEGKIWRAVLDVNNMTELLVNGREIEDLSPIMPRPVPGSYMMYRSRAIDIAPYLKPGKNRFCLRSERAFAWVRGSVILTSGERIPIDTHSDWRWSTAAPADWTAADFNIAAWPTVPGKKTGPAVPYAAPVTSYGFSYRYAGDQPADDGLMALTNPDDDTLFFRNDRDARLNIEIPNGFRNRKPVIAWALERYDDGKTQPVKNDKTDAFSYRDASLSFNLNLGKLPMGAYLLSTTLLLDGKVAEARPPEPMISVGKLDLREVAGDTYEQGMDLELEDTIDFANPDDPKHPWMETDAAGRYPSKNGEWTEAFVKPPLPALIVEKNGLKYRETRARFEAQFSYKVSFNHPNDFYLMVLEYPDDMERWMGVSCSTATRTHDPKKGGYVGDESAKCGPAIWTGGKYPNSGEIREMKWLYRPDPGFHAVNVMSLGKNMAAAASKLRIYHVKGHLPALKINAPDKNQRLLGLLSERTWPSSGFSTTFGVRKERKENTLGYLKAGPEYVPALKACAELTEYLDTCQAYVEYLRFTGQNLHVMGCFQYDDKNTCFESNSNVSRVPFDLRDVAARVFLANGIDFLASVEFIDTMRLRKKAAEARERSGSNYNPYCLVDKDGVQRSGARGTGADENWNFIHPEVESEMLDVAEELAIKFKGLPNFLGVNWTAFFGGGWIPSFRVGDQPFDASYDDATIAAFEKDTGVKVPGAVDNPKRFQERYAFLTAPDTLPLWTQWRCQKIRDFFAKVAARLKKHRIDLVCHAGCYTVPEHIEEWNESGKSFKQYAGEWGWDKAMFAENKSLRLTGWLVAAACYAPAFRVDDYANGWQGNVSPEFYEAFDNENARAIMLNYNWLEIERVTALMPHKPDWPRPYQSTMQVQQAGDFAREPYVQAMIGFDPNVVMFGFTDASLYIGQEQQLRAFARVFRALPNEKFAKYGDTGFATNFAIRQLKKADKLYFYVVNPGYWPIEGEITVRGATNVVNLVSSDNAAAGMFSSAVSVPIKLGPFDIAAFVADGADAALERWETDPLDAKDLKHMNDVLADAKRAEAISGFAGFVGKDAFARLEKTIADAENALANKNYARAWSLLTGAEFWTLVYQKAEDMKYVDITRKKAAVLKKTIAPPKIDGKLLDQAWKDLAPLTGFVTAEKALAPYETSAYVCRDDNNLYVAFDCRDKNPGAIRKTAKDELDVFASGDDAVAMFIQPDPGKNAYYQLAATAGGVRFDQKNLNGQAIYGYSPEWTVRTETNPNGWTIEMKIPVKAIDATFKPGDKWAMNFHRVVRENQLPVASWTWQPKWHDIEKLGEMTIKE